MPKPARTTPSRDNVRNGGDWLSDATLKSDFENDSTGQCSSVACSVDYETRDGSAKHGVDYHKLKGTLVSVVTLHILLKVLLVTMKNN